VGAGEVREDLPDDRGIVRRGDQARAAATPGARQHVDAERASFPLTQVAESVEVGGKVLPAVG